jgi:RND family efflux transporter MFP subunit
MQFQPKTPALQTSHYACYTKLYMPAKKLGKLEFIKRHKILTLIAVVILIIIGYFLWPKPPKPLETYTVKTGSITDSLSVTGTIHSLTAVDLTFIAGGKLTYVGVGKGDYVKKGQVIATLDQRSLQNQLTTALRNYSEQRNTFDQTIDNNNGIADPNQSLNTAMKRILQNNQYDLDKAVLSVELQALTNEQSVLASPIDGIITRADVKTAGLTITPATTFTVADPNNLVFKMDIDEADIGSIREGQPANVILDAFPDKTFNLKISQIDFATHKTDTGGDAYTVEAELPNDNDLNYRIGMNGDADITIAQRKDVLIIPIASLTDDQAVYLKTGNNKFEKRKVKLGIKSDTDAEVVSGLKKGDQIAVQPTEAEKLVKPKNNMNPLGK